MVRSTWEISVLAAIYTKMKLLATHFCRVTQGIVCVFCAGGGYLTVPYQMCVFTDGFG